MQFYSIGFPDANGVGTRPDAATRFSANDHGRIDRAYAELQRCRDAFYYQLKCHTRLFRPTPELRRKVDEFDRDRSKLLRATPPLRLGLYEHAVAYFERYKWATTPVNSLKKPTGKFSYFFQSDAKFARSFKPFHNQVSVKRSFNVGLALVTGTISGMTMVIDFDAPELYRRFAEAFPDEAQNCPTSVTRRGFGVVCKSRDMVNADLRHTAGIPVEFKCATPAYVVIPPAVTQVEEGGLAYHRRRWLIDPADVPTSLPTLDWRVVAAALSPTGAAYSFPEPPRPPEPPPPPQPLPEPVATDPVNWRPYVPPGLGTRNRRTFDFARALRSHDPAAPFEAHLPSARHWAAETVRRATTRLKNCRGHLRNLRYAYDRVRHPVDLLAQCRRRSLAMRPHTRQHCPDATDDECLVLGVVVALQEHHERLGKNTDPYLSARSAAALTGTTPQGGLNALNRLIRKGYLTRTKHNLPCNPNNPADRRNPDGHAHEYRVPDAQYDGIRPPAATPSTEGIPPSSPADLPPTPQTSCVYHPTPPAPGPHHDPP